MIHVTVEKSAVNVEALDADLHTALGEAALGMSWDGREVAVYLSGDAVPAQVNQARQIVVLHDPTRLTLRQQAEAERQAGLESLRADNAAALDPTAFANETDAVQTLARRVAWLEQEFLARQ